MGLVKVPVPKKAWGSSSDDWSMFMKGAVTVGSGHKSTAPHVGGISGGIAGALN